MQFLPDSPEQIAESMKRLGPVRGQLHEALREAIDKVNNGQKESDQPAIGDDSKDDAPPK